MRTRGCGKISIPISLFAIFTQKAKRKIECLQIEFERSYKRLASSNGTSLLEKTAQTCQSMVKEQYNQLSVMEFGYYWKVLVVISIWSNIPSKCLSQITGRYMYKS